MHTGSVARTSIGATLGRMFYSWEGGLFFPNRLGTSLACRNCGGFDPVHDMQLSIPSQALLFFPLFFPLSLSFSPFFCFFFLYLSMIPFSLAVYPAILYNCHLCQISYLKSRSTMIHTWLEYTSYFCAVVDRGGPYHECSLPFFRRWCCTETVAQRPFRTEGMLCLGTSRAN